MLLERMARARDTLLQRQASDVSQSVVGWHVEARAALHEQAERLQALATTASSLRATGVLRGPLGERPFTVLRRDLSVAEKTIRDAADGLPAVSLTQLVERTKAGYSHAERAVRQAWLAHLDRMGATAASEEVIRHLRQMGLAPVAEALGQASRLLQIARSELPKTAAGIESVSAARTAVEEAWRNASITPEMVPQVTKLTGLGLPLAEASDELLRWLRARKLDGNVRLRLG